jgi:uncharacterized membrane protein YdjX (TVP38/TMEM64 family)
MDPMPHASSATPPAPRISWRKLTLVALVVVIALMLVNTPAVRVQLGNWRAVKDQIRSYGVPGMLACTFSAGALIACGVPRLWLCVPAGGLYGFWLGLLLMQCATLGGSYVTFLIVRWTGLHYAVRQLERHALVRALTRNHTPWSVFMVRQLPLHGMAMNMALAASSVGHLDFLLGSFIGFLPQGIVVTLIGSGIGKPDDPRLATTQLLLALLCAVAVAAVIYRAIRALGTAKAEHE